MDLEKLVAGCRQQLAPGAMAVKKAEGFDLTLLCAVVADGTVVTTSLSGLRGHLPTSAALASPAMERFFLLQALVGFDQAFEQCSEDDEEGNGEEFVRAWDESQQDLAGGVVCTLNDLAAMVTQAKNGWLQSPKRLLVVAREGADVISGTVDTDWILAGIY